MAVKQCPKHDTPVEGGLRVKCSNVVGRHLVTMLVCQRGFVYGLQLPIFSQFLSPQSSCKNVNCNMHVISFNLVFQPKPTASGVVGNSWKAHLGPHKARQKATKVLQLPMGGVIWKAGQENCRHLTRNSRGQRIPPCGAVLWRIRKRKLTCIIPKSFPISIAIG